MKTTHNFWPLVTKLGIAVGAIVLTLGLSWIRVNAQLDPTFGTNGISAFVDGNSRDSMGFFSLPDGKFLSVSNRSAFGSGPYDLIRLNADGSPDTSYGIGGVVQLPIPLSNSGVRGIHAAARQPDGKIVVAGADSGDGIVSRFNPDGTLDTSFSNDGVDRLNVDANGSDTIWSVLVQPDGKITVGGYAFMTSRTFLVRYNSDGTRDSTFGSQGISLPGSNVPSVLRMQSTGKYVAVVGASNGGRLKRFNADGSIDTAFPLDNNTVYMNIAIQPDDKILGATYVERSESVGRTYYDNVIKRFNADGTIDSSFGIGGSVTFNWNPYTDGVAQGITVLSDGRLLVTGYADIAINRSKYIGIVGGAALLSPAGVVIGKFLMPGFPQMSLGNHVVVLPDGKFVFGGVVTSTSSIVPWKLRFARVTGVPLETYHFKGNPFDFYFSMDNIAEPTVFRPGNSLWYGPGGFPFGTASDIMVPADYIKNFSYKDDFSTDLAYFRPSTGDWYISPNNGNPADTIVIHWGQNGDIPVPADYDGDAKADVAIFRPSTGDWWIRNSNDNSITAIHWGMTGDKPVHGDYDGDGRDDIAVFRPSNGDWYILKSSGEMLFLHFGSTGDIPVQEDYDGDGKADISVWRPSDGGWYRLNSSDGSFYGLYWGLSTDIPVPADYDGDLRTDISVWRPSEATWYIFSSITNTMVVKYLGQSTDIPVAARH